MQYLSQRVNFAQNNINLLMQMLHWLQFLNWIKTENYVIIIVMENSQFLVYNFIEARKISNIISINCFIQEHKSYVSTK